MPAKPTHLPSVEESLKAAAASGAETRRILDQMARDSAKWEAEREARRKKREAEHEKWKAEQETILAESNKALAEARASLEKTEETLKGTADWLGLTNDKDYIFSGRVYDVLREAKEICGIAVGEVDGCLFKHYCNRQYDMLCANDSSVIVVDIRHTLQALDVGEFALELPSFPNTHPEHMKGRELRGAVVYRKLGSRFAAQTALDNGFLLMRAGGRKHLKLHQIKTLADLRKPETARARAKLHGSVL